MELNDLTFAGITTGVLCAWIIGFRVVYGPWMDEPTFMIYFTGAGLMSIFIIMCLISAVSAYLDPSAKRVSDLFTLNGFIAFLLSLVAFSLFNRFFVPHITHNVKHYTGIELGGKRKLTRKE